MGNICTTETREFNHVKKFYVPVMPQPCQMNMCKYYATYKDGMGRNVCQTCYRKRYQYGGV